MTLTMNELKKQEFEQKREVLQAQTKEIQKMVDYSMENNEREILLTLSQSWVSLMKRDTEIYQEICELNKMISYESAKKIYEHFNK